MHDLDENNLPFIFFQPLLKERLIEGGRGLLEIGNTARETKTTYFLLHAEEIFYMYFSRHTSAKQNNLIEKLLISQTHPWTFESERN